VNEWQPIETAPKDGSDILGAWHWSYTDEDTGETESGWCIDKCHWVEDENSTGWRASINAARPTHWMPLPDPPKESEE
jgi:hypothetical protein